MTDIENKICDSFKAGRKCNEICIEYGLSPFVVAKVVADNKLYRRGSFGKAIKTQRDIHKRAEYLAMWLPLYKCLRIEFLSICGGSKRMENGTTNNTHMANRFLKQRSNAIKRGISFTISFPDWIKIWQDSGHIEEIGKGYGRYVMARKTDNGGYEVGNVSIVHSIDNIREYYDVSRYLQKNGE